MKKTRRRAPIVLAVMTAAALAGLIHFAVADEPARVNGITPNDTELLPNGNFEQGSTSWTESSVQGLDLIRDLRTLSITAHSGTWGAVLGIANNEIASIEQSVKVPTGSPALKYWYQIGSVDTHLGFDFARLLVNGVKVDEFQLHEGINTSVWTLHAIDLTAYAGQTVNIQIQVETDIVDGSTLIVDDVFFDFDPSSGSIFQDGFETGDTSRWSMQFP